MRQQTSSYVGSLWEARCDAEQQLLALARVVKVPPSVDKDTEQNLAQAAWDSMELDDESIVRIADVVFGTGWFALVHDHYDGDTVRTMQRRVAERKSAVPVPVALRIVIDAIEAVRKATEAADELGVSWELLTLDPGSLLVCDDGRTRLLDGFVGGYVPSVPKMARDTETLAYAAPEMFEDQPKLDARTHVFRIAIIAWELLCSKRLLVGSKPVMQRRLQTPFIRADRVTRVGASASERLAKVVEKALSIDPNERFENLSAFEKALRDAGDKVGTQEDVIQFADALAGRESTLARLVMDKPKRLSDAIKSVRPTADVKKSFAAHVRSTDAAIKSTVAKQARVPRIGKAPDALFSAPARKAATAPNPPQPPAFTATAVVAASPPVPAAAPAPLPASVTHPNRVEPPDPARRTAPPPMPSTVAATAQRAAGIPVPGAPRERFKTLVGLSAQDFSPQGPAAAAAELFEPAPDSISQVTTAEPDGAETDEEADDALDALYDAPTQAYNVAQFAEVAAEAKGVRERMESGPRLANAPPDEPVAAPSRPDFAQTMRQAPLPPALQPPALDPALRAPAQQPVDPGFHDSLEAEPTLPAVQGHSQSERGGLVAAGAPNVPVVAPPSAASPREAEPSGASAKVDKRLLVLTLFFAGTTLALAVLAAGLFVRSRAAEQSASALAGAPVVQMPSPAKPAPAPTAAPRPPAPVAATAPATAEPEPAVADTEPTDKGEPTDESAEATRESEHEDTPESATSATPTPPAPKPVRRPVVRKAKPRATTKPKHYVPADI